MSPKRECVAHEESELSNCFIGFLRVGFEFASKLTILRNGLIYDI